MEQSDKLLLRSSPSKDTTPEMGIRLGHALAMDYKKVVIGMDLMRSSPMMKNALISGLISSGVDVIDVGKVSEPVMA
jgi:phosphoglucosamine mutase